MAGNNKTIAAINAAQVSVGYDAGGVGEVYGNADNGHGYRGVQCSGTISKRAVFPAGLEAVLADKTVPKVAPDSDEPRSEYSVMSRSGRLSDLYPA